MEHTPTSALPGETVICYCNHTAHPTCLQNATGINFFPINKNLELLLPNLLVGAHVQLEVLPAPQRPDRSKGMHVQHPAGLSQRSARLLPRAHLAASRQAITLPGEGSAAHQRPDKPRNLRWSCARLHSSAQSSSDSGQNKPAANI